MSVRNSADLRLVAENARDGIIIQALDSKILWCNPAFCQMTGYSEAECIGRSPLEFLIPEADRKSYEEIENFRFQENDDLFNRFETLENVRKDGTRYHIQISHSAAETSNIDGKAERRVVTTCRDITYSIKRDKALMEAQFDMISMIQTDNLTGLFSRAYVHNWLQQRLAQNPVAPFFALAIDIMDCQSISETLGHAVSDAIITHVGQTIRMTAPEEAVVARSGDDAFLLVLPDFQNLKDVLRIWNGIERALSEPMRIGGGLKPISVSVGITAHPGKSNTVTSFMRNLQAARAHGLKRHHRHLGYYSDALHQKASRQTTLRLDLPNALDSTDIHFHAQPIVRLSDQALSGFELLIRWTHPTLGAVPPNDFIPVAGELGLMNKIDKLAANQAIALHRILAKNNLPDIRVGFNLSAEAVLSAEFCTWMEWKSDASEVDPTRIIIEILETTVFSSDLRFDEAALHIDRMRSAGFNIFLDDFGVGYAGLAHLAGLSANGLKIDRSLITNLAKTESSRIIIASMLKLAADLGLEGVAEGVETEEQLAHLKDLGCPKVQGFGIARPMPLNQILPWIEERHPIQCAAGHAPSQPLRRATTS